ncbi:ArnT family glycosyltransferase [Singulisphaera sp. PoT]|uniref:ArnT family glycosyltransferase n=1 Tax=Singulisphaera sp. PoT TaxID=3411797 RepID=UPI003BF48A8A
MADQRLGRSRRWAILSLLIILVFDVWLRGHTFGPTLRERWGINLWPVSGRESEPLDCDECVYAYAGRRIIHGDVMYRDLTEPKPPGGYWLGAAIMAMGGDTELDFRLVTIPFVLGTISLCWWMGMRLQGPIAACVAALVYGVVSTDPYLFGNGSNLEHAINLFAFGSLACMVKGWTLERRRWYFASGLAIGLAAVFKQIAVVHFVVFAVALMTRRRTWSLKAKDIAGLTAGLGAVFLLVSGVLLAQGAGAAAFEDIVRYGAAMARDTPPDPGAPPAWMRWLTGNADPQGKLPWPFGKTDYLVWWGTGSWPVWLAAIPSLAVLGLSRGSTGPRRLLVAWTCSAFVQVVLPGLYWQHYYLLPVPGLAVAVAVHLADVLGAVRRVDGRSLLAASWVTALGLLLVGTAVIQTRAYLLVAPESLTKEYKGGAQWIALRAMGRDLAERSKVWKDPRLFLWGWQSPLFVYGNLDGVSRHFFADPLMKAFANQDHPLIVPRVERIMQDLEERPPELILTGDPPFPALRRFLEAGYIRSRLWGSAPDGRGLWVERGHYREFETAATSTKNGDSVRRPVSE